MTEETAGTPTTHAPQIIYLQDGGEDEPLRSEFYDDQVTWCADSIADNDTKYIRFDVHEREVAALTTQRDELQKRIGYTAVPVTEGGANIDRRKMIEEVIGYMWTVGQVECMYDDALYRLDVGIRALADTGMAQATECETNGTEGLRAELDAAKRALAEMRLVVIKECECYLHSSGTGSICGLHKCDKNAALAAKSTEQGGP